MSKNSSILLQLGLSLLVGTAAANAEPIGRWFYGYGQGVLEYGIKNDSAGGDYFSIWCDYKGAGAWFIVSRKDPLPLSSVFVVINDDQFEIPVREDHYFHTDSHVEYSIFRSLWEAIRTNNGVMHVRLSSGETTTFPLKGAAKALPKEPCETAFEK